jgi:methionyl-tRNA formyltransferase
MLMVSHEPIGPDDSSASLHNRLAKRGADLVVAGLAAWPLAARPQPAQGVCYAHKIDKSEAAIDWRASAETIERRVRAFDPFPGASFQRAGETIKLWRARVVPTAGGGAAPGTVVALGADGPVVACGQGALALLTLQRPGGKRVEAATWAAPKPLAIGESLDQSLTA